MGIAIQKSCLLVPDARVKKVRRGPQKNLPKQTRRKLMRRRLQYWNNLLQEAQVWMDLILLPTGYIANGDAYTKAKIDWTNEQLKLKLLGKHVTDEKITRVCGKIVRNIFVPGLANVHPGHKHVPDHPSEDKLASVLDQQPIAAKWRAEIYKRCRNFRENHPAARTWLDFRQVAHLYMYRGKPLIEKLNEWQRIQTFIDLGLPHLHSWTLDERIEMIARIRSPNMEKLERRTNFLDNPWLADLIIVGAAGERSDRFNVAASMSSRNMMVLWPSFWEEFDYDMLREVSVQPGFDIGHWLSRCTLFVIFHELTHSRSILASSDHIFQYIEDEIDYIDPESLYHATKGGTPSPDLFIAYELDPCLALTRRDEIYGTNKAEDNAESWALYIMLRVLSLVYPEIDFVSCLQTPDVMNPPYRKVQRRRSLLHHWTAALQPLRGTFGAAATPLELDPRWNRNLDPWHRRPSLRQDHDFQKLREILRAWRSLIAQDRDANFDPAIHNYSTDMDMEEWWKTFEWTKE